MAMPRNAGAMNRVAVNVLGTGLVLALAGCGGGGSSSAKGTGGSTLSGGGTGGISGGGSGGAGGTVVASGTPVDMCKQFGKVMCTREGQCSGTALTPAQQTDCEGIWNVENNCDATPTGIDFSACLTDIQVLSCASLIQSDGTPNPPQACQNQINNIPSSDAQIKCAALIGAFCDRLAQCAGLPQSASDACLSSNLTDPQNGVPCFDAISVSASYPQCLSTYQNMACPNPDAGTDGGSDGGVAGGDAGATMMTTSACITSAIGFF